MTDKDRPFFAELMLGIAEVYGEQISEVRMELYFRSLKDLPLPAIRLAAESHIRNQRFFPRPAELREHVDGGVEERTESAWSYVREQVRRVGYMGSPSWPDEATRRAATELYGSWRRLCSSLPADGPGLYTAAQQFKAIYRAHDSRNTRMAARVAAGDPQSPRRGLKETRHDESE